MKEIRTEIEIAAPTERVWQVLTGFERYGEWNPFFREARGEARSGARLVVHGVLEGGRAMTFKPTVLEAEAPRSLRWRGTLPVPGLFTGEHWFRLEPLGADRTRLVHGETFSGLLVPLLWPKMLDRQTRSAFQAMNHALKARAEGA